MNVGHVEILVEEPSMEAALRLLLPRLLKPISFEIYPFQCKDELLQRLPDRLHSYARWLPEAWRIIVVVDQDNDNCWTLKQKLKEMVRQAGLATRSVTTGAPYQVVNRLVVEELEAWYFGDWEAVKTAYPRVSATVPQKDKYRNPDAIQGGTWEAFERILQQVGYFKGGLRKIEAARAITQHMDLERNTSRSFQLFRDVLLEMVDA